MKKAFTLKGCQYAPEQTQLFLNGANIELSTLQRQNLHKWYYKTKHTQGDLTKYVRENIFVKTSKFVKTVSIVKNHSLQRLQELNSQRPKSGIFTDYKQILNITKNDKDNGILSLIENFDNKGNAIYKQYENNVTYDIKFNSLYI